jgi:hypothetical protein
LHWLLLLNLDLRLHLRVSLLALLLLLLMFLAVYCRRTPLARCFSSSPATSGAPPPSSVVWMVSALPLLLPLPPMLPRLLQLPSLYCR